VQLRERREGGQRGFSPGEAATGQGHRNRESNPLDALDGEKEALEGEEALEFLTASDPSEAPWAAIQGGVESQPDSTVPPHQYYTSGLDYIGATKAGVLFRDLFSSGLSPLSNPDPVWRSPSMASRTGGRLQPGRPPTLATIGGPRRRGMVASPRERHASRTYMLVSN
jgi:hypothetical protein